MFSFSVGKCCVTRTATFCLSGTGAGFGSGSSKNWDKNVKIIKNERPTFWEIMLLLALKNTRFVTNFVLLENYAKYCLDPEPESKLFPSRIRNRIQNFSKVGTGTATNHYCPTTLLPCGPSSFLRIFSYFLRIEHILIVHFTIMWQATISSN